MTQGNRLKVLIVDDDEIQLTVLRSWLEHDGYEVCTRNSAFGTSSAVLREHPDIVILDLEMPGLTGDAVAKLIGSLSGAKRIGIIFYSGNEVPNLPELAKEARVLGAIRKTRQSEVFREQFSRLVGRIAPRRPEG